MKRKNPQMTLQITSMADVFVIVLVFLLKSYASNAMQLNPSAQLKLPEADKTTEGENATSDALKVEVSENAVLIEGQTIVNLEDFKLRPATAAAELSKLQQEFEKERKRQDIIASVNPDVKKDSRLVVMSDSRVPYSTLKEVLKLAAGSGFSDYQFAVIKGEGQ